MNVIAVTALYFATLLAISRGYASGPLSAEVCRKFHVTHTQSDSLPPETVDVVLRDTHGREVSCFVPENRYTVELKGNWRENTDPTWRTKLNGGLAGFLLKANRGQISLHDPEDDTYFAHKVCGQSMSHRDILSNSMKFHPTYPRLLFNYTAGATTKELDFRYTAVFDIRHHVENLHKKYPVCSDDCSYSTESSTSTQTREESNDSRDQHSEPIQGEVIATPAPTTTCNRTVVTATEELKLEAHNTTYTCESKKPIKRLFCEEQCSGSRPGSKICCHPKNTIHRRKGFTCVADSNERPSNAPQAFDTTIQVEITSGGCVCMDCCNMTNHPLESLN